MATSTGTQPPAPGVQTPATAPLVAPVISTKSVGITGTTNYGGDIFAESNAKLLYEAAYGQAGTREWGEWEEFVRTDSAVAAGLDFVCGPIRDARADVEPVDDSPEEAAIAELVRWNLTEALEPTFPELLTQASKGMLGTGFALFEPTFAKRVNERFPGGVGFAIDKVAQRLPATLAHNAWLETEDGAELRAVKQQGPRGNQWVIAEIPAERLLLFTWGRTGNNYAGFSAFRPVWYIGQIRRELLRLIGVTYQREGAGVPVMTTTDKTAELTGKQRTDAEELLANLVYHENASLVPPAGWTLEWKFSGGANKGHVIDAWHRLGLAILEQVQAQQLALGTGDTGSRSVGTVHDASARAFIASVIAVLEGVFNGVGSRPYTGLVRRLVDANYGPRAQYPRVRLTLKQAQLSPKEMLEAIKTGVDAKALTITAADENALREKLGLSPIDEDEREAELDRRAALAPVIQVPPGGAVPGAQPSGLKARLRAAAPRPGRAWTPWRELRASEKRTDFNSMERFLSSRPVVFEQAVRPLVMEMLARAAPAITAAMADGNVTPAEVAALPLDTKRLADALAGFAAEVREEGKRTVRRELRDDAAERLLEQRRLAAAEEEQEEDERDDEVIAEADSVVSAQTDLTKRRIEQRLRAEIEREAIDTNRTGGDASEVIARVVQAQLDTGAFRNDALFVTTKAFNVGRDEAARIIGGVSSVEYSAYLDSGTCGECRGMDGRTAAFDSEEHDAMLPPNRDCEGGERCRCVLVFLRGGE